MAPKKAKEGLNDAPVLTEEQQTASLLSQRLQAAAKSQGVLSSTRRIVTEELPTPKLLLRADGKDLIKKSSQRKGRYLFNICAQIALAAAGKLGSLAQLDSQNPVLYVDFPQGRLKFLGTIVFPRNKYMLLKFGQKDVLCEDVFENMIVFPEAHWIGTKEDNPAEKELPMPAELQTAVQHEKYAFGGAATQTGTQPTQTQPDADEEDNDNSDDEHDEDEAGPSQPTRKSGRDRGKRPRYAEPGMSGSDEEAIEIQDSDGEEPTQKLPKLSQRETPSQGRRKSSGKLQDSSQSDAKPKGQKGLSLLGKPAGRATARRGVLASESDDDGHDDDDDADDAPAIAGKCTKQSTLKSFATGSGSRPKASGQPPGSGKKATAAKRSSKAADVIDLLDDDSPGPSTKSQGGSAFRPTARAPRKARASYPKSLKEPSLSESEDKESQGSSDVEAPSAEEDDDADEDFEA